jgi:hypothetical protein
MNTYEQMLLNDERKLKDTIRDLIEEQIDNNDKEPEELKEIRKVIDFGFHITAYCNFETKTPVLSGRKNFHSIDEYYNREDYDHCTHDVDWDEEFDDDGYFNWTETPSICIDRICLRAPRKKSLFPALAVHKKMPFGKC